MLRRIWRFLVGLFALVGFFTVVLATLLAVLGIAVWRELAPGPEVPDRLVLAVDLRGSLADRAEPPPWALLQPEPELDLTDTVLALDRAARDPRVAGLVARIDATAHGFAVAQELRDAIARFRRAGKFALAHADSFGGLGPGNEGYLLASAFERIVLRPEGVVGLTGPAIEIPYLRGLLDRLGIDAEVVQREEYKTAFESFVAREPSPAQIEMTDALLDRVEAQWLTALAEGRGIEVDRLRRIVDGGPYPAEDALALGLVDALGPLDAVEQEARERAGAGAELWPLARYAASPAEREMPGDAARVAVVRASGLVAAGPDGAAGIDADRLASVLADAVEDDGIDAVLLRLDSPGGEPAAAATVARALERLREAGKPVVVSLGNVGASGGYWIASAADRILAWPGTLTGSIGVIAGKPVLARLWEMLDVRWARFSRGAQAGLGSLNRPYDADERARIEALVDALYARFLEQVAEGRGLPRERVRRLARGRVYTGEEARELGLVDALGGVLAAREAMPELLGLPPGSPAELRRYPEEGLAPERLLRFLERLPLSVDTRFTLPVGPPAALAVAPPLRIR